KPKGLNLINQALVKEWFKVKALKIIEKKLDHFGKKFGLKYKRIRITNARTRWGSCSYDNSLNFSWKIITAPKKIVDYVIIHEMAHLRHKNHSTRFWNLVAEMMPDYEKYDQWLKKNHFLLHF
ncbi:MAG TPA: M48 family metallopeptidase, partial [Rickettsiales bacterium]|nr:M48 family metallopeptidase [Rickettsiales bacterium]